MWCVISIFFLVLIYHLFIKVKESQEQLVPSLKSKIQIPHNFFLCWVLKFLKPGWGEEMLFHQRNSNITYQQFYSCLH